VQTSGEIPPPEPISLNTSVVEERHGKASMIVRFNLEAPFEVETESAKTATAV